MKNINLKTQRLGDQGGKSKLWRLAWGMKYGLPFLVVSGIGLNPVSVDAAVSNTATLTADYVSAVEIKSSVCSAITPEALTVESSVTVTSSGRRNVTDENCLGVILLDYGNASASYDQYCPTGPSSCTDDPPVHMIYPNFHIGTSVTYDTGDQDGGALPADVDGITITTPHDGDTNRFRVVFTVTGDISGLPATGEPQAMLCGYLDGAADGQVDGVFTRDINYGTNARVGTALDHVAGDSNEELCVRVVDNNRSRLKHTIPGGDPFYANASCEVSLDNRFSCTLTWDPAYTTDLNDIWARFRLTADTDFFKNTPLDTPPASPNPVRPADSGEVSSVTFNLKPTLAVINDDDVKLVAIDLSVLFDDLDLLQMSDQALRELLLAWNPDAILSGGREDLIEQIRHYLDPDGDGKTAVLSWKTQVEIGTLGFYVERRSDNDRWQKINHQMLPGLFSPLGAKYLLIDPRAQSGHRYTYRILEQEATGQIRYYGPYTLDLQ